MMIQFGKHNRQGGLTFILTQQPPNSPDCNILDLSFFRSIQSLMYKKMTKNMTKLITTVEDASGELHPKTLCNNPEFPTPCTKPKS